ncbi:hypothetical protein [Novosphingobium naphthalenivorans]|uniref:hypothetical protein n=1 Tax=Novosphingobium naphthalenivorans TaxID=273168 RepID=UPI000AFBBBD5|nr:hypothetical protein [Novosphingobium naphthalenivorans]
MAPGYWRHDAVAIAEMARSAFVASAKATADKDPLKSRNIVCDLAAPRFYQTAHPSAARS